jgi:hypothetical protein
VQIIIDAVEYARMQGILGDTFYLSTLDYSPGSEAYPWLSTCAQAVMRKKRGKALLNRRLREFFGFTFEPREDGLQIILEDGFHADLGFLDIEGLSSKPPRVTRVTRTTSALETLEGLESLETLEETLGPSWSPTGGEGQQGLEPPKPPEPRDPDNRLVEMLKEVAFTFQERNHGFISTGQARERLGWETDLFERVLRKCIEEHKATGSGLRLTSDGGLNLVW